MAQWLRTTSLKIAAGELKEIKGKPGEGATPEQVAAWRKENGLPEKATDYVAGLKLGDGIVPGEADKPLLEAVAGMAHERGYSQETMNDFVGMYYDLQNKQVAAREAADGDYRRESEAMLQQQMGADFKANMNALRVFWSNAPEGLSDTILGARLADGRMVGDIPEVTTWLASLARDLDPAATLLPPGGGDQKTISGRITELEALMYKDSAVPGRWGPHYTEAAQKELRDLYDARDRMKARGRAA